MSGMPRKKHGVSCAHRDALVGLQVDAREARERLERIALLTRIGRHDEAQHHTIAGNLSTANVRHDASSKRDAQLATGPVLVTRTDADPAASSSCNWRRCCLCGRPVP